MDGFEEFHYLSEARRTAMKGSRFLETAAQTSKTFSLVRSKGFKASPQAPGQ